MTQEADPIDVNAVRDDLLIALARQGSSNTKPLSPIMVLKGARADIDWDQFSQVARDAGWLLVRSEPPFARNRPDSKKPNMMLLALTAAGKARASELLRARKPLKFSERLKKIPFGKGAWEIVKLTLAAIAGAAAKSYFG